MAEQPQPPTIDDGDLGDSLPTLYINRFFMRTGTIASRLVLGELVHYQSPTNWRGAFLMANEDMELLAHLILDQLGKTHPPQPKPEPSETIGSGTEAIFNHGKTDK